MKRLLLFASLLLACVGISAAQDTTDPVLFRESAPDPASIRLEPFASGFDRPLYVTSAGDGSGRLFVVEQSGRIHVYSAEGVNLGVFLDTTDLVSPNVFSGGYTERGLLGLAFHPDYADNGLFFINYTDRGGATAVARYSVSADPDRADPASADVIFSLAQPFPNHNGGHMDFGPDGYLYISLGDGGAAGDPLDAGQNTGLLLGSILRLDVNSDSGYTIPADNPFVNSDQGEPEIWAYGLRNVWRFSFDRATGDMYLGDVGQNQVVQRLLAHAVVGLQETGNRRGDGLRPGAQRDRVVEGEVVAFRQ